MYIIIGVLITLALLLICIIIAKFISKTIEHRLKDMMNKVREADEIARKAIEAKNSMSYLNNILNGMDAMIYVTEPSTGEILFMNDNMKLHYNIEGDGVGQLCYKVLQEGLDAKCDFCPCRKLDKDPDTIVVWEEHSPLTNRVYHNVDRYINWPNRNKVHMQHSVDITELVAARESAEQSNRSKGIFLAQMSHEIRTPMNAILGISEIQLRDPSLSSSAEDGYRKIYESGNLLMNIINDILDFSKIDAGKMEIVLDKYDIPSLVNDTVLLNRLRCESKAIEFILKVDENTPLELIGDGLRIRQILNNLLSNAFKYTETGEVILSINAEPSRDKDTVILVFRVSDTGCGMNKEQLDILFEEYSRFNIQTNRGVTGTGLGMTITKRLLDIMDGEIFVESEVDKGSVFTVHLPQKKHGAAVCGKEVADRLSSFTFSDKTISKKTQIIHEYMPYGKVLIVDDVESNLYVAKGLMLPYGLHVETVNSGFKAIEAIKNNPDFDIIFMDHMMPKMDGIQTTEVMREMGYTRPIIALTANAVVGQAEMFLSNGFDNFIAKPIDTRKMDIILKDYIRDKKPPEVVEAARKEYLEKETGNNRSPSDNAAPNVNIELAVHFAHDAVYAVNFLKTIIEKTGDLNDDDINTYITTVHGVKSALANIGEKELSAIALKLEKAGREKNLTLIMEETPVLINALQFLIDKYKTNDNNDTIEISNEDKIFLQEKLNIIKAACDTLDLNKIEEVLKEVKKKTWTYEINDSLDDISVYLLRADLKKIVPVIDKIIKFL